MRVPRGRRAPIVALAYLLLACVMFAPLVRHLRSGVPHDLGDPLLNTWILWWNARAIPFTAEWWNAPMFWPIPDALAFSENLLGIAVLSTPLQWLGAHPLLAYNAVLLLSWPLSAIAAHALAWHLTRRTDAALIAGLVFGFAQYRLGQLPHVQVLACWWMPVALLALHRALEAQTPRRAGGWLALFAVAWMLQALTNGYFLVYFSVVVGLWIAWFALRRPYLPIAASMIAVWVVAALLLAPVLLHYRDVHAQWHFTRGSGVIEFFSADLTSFVTAPGLLAWWPFRPNAVGEQALYPGVFAAALATAGVLVAMWPPRALARWQRALVFGLSAAAALFAVSALATLVLGQWRIGAGPIVITGRRAARPLAIAAACALVAAGLNPRVRRAVGARALLAFYAGAAAIGFAMCLGPTGRLMGEPIISTPPYWWLMKLPGLDSLRVPTRFMMVAALPFAVAASLGFARITRRLSPSARFATATACVVLLVIDSWPRAIPLHAFPRSYSVPAAARDAVIIEMPVGEIVDDDVAALARGMAHGQPVVNGYSGYFPEPYYLLREALRERDGSVLLAMGTLAPLCLVVDTNRAQARNSRRIAASIGAPLLEVQGDFSFYLLRRREAPRFVPGTAVRIANVTAPESGARSRWVADGRLDTYWESTARQQGREELTLELARETSVGGIALTQGSRLGDYPRYLVLETSVDGRSWQPAWEGQTAGLVYLAALRDFDRSRFTIPFDSRSARFVRLRQTASGTKAYWALAEVDVITRETP